MGGPTTIGPYRVLRILGQGGMGIVYVCEDPALGRELAVKLLDLAEADPDARARFQREAEALARVRHPGVVAIHALGESERGAYLAMDLVPGEPLSRLLEQAPLPDELALRVVRDLADAVAALHAAGILHRDIKPANAILRPEGAPVLLDFGLAREADAQTLTKTGSLLGTVHYMAPEQAAGRPTRELTPACDVYSLGVILYQALAGRRPHEGSPVNVLTALVRGDERPLEELRPDAPAGLRAVVGEALASDPRQRYPSAAELRDDLSRLLAGEPPAALDAAPAPGRAARLGGLALALALGFGLLAALWLRPAPPPPLELRFELRAPRAGALVLTPEVAVEGALLGRPPGEYELSCGARRLRIRTGEPFQLRVPLPPGESELRLALSQHAQITTAIRLTRHALPAWLAQLPPAERPPLPLPPGVEALPEPGRYRLVRDDSELIYHPPGSFTMGHAAGSYDEQPPHRVTLSEGFFLGRLEVSRAQVEAFRRAHQREPRWPGDERGSLPGCAHWEDARAYCEWVGARLPSEAEWAYAARGAEGREFPWGDEPPRGRRANLGGVAGELAPVGSFPRDATPRGVLDLAGNAREWVADAHAAYPADARRRVDPRVSQGPGGRRVRRGGAHGEPAETAQAWRRSGERPAHDNHATGFRVCVSAR